MKHKIRDTSLLAFADILENLGDRQEIVFRALKMLGSANNNMIAHHLNKPINEVTPRCQELRKLGLVIFHKKAICPYTQRLTTYWKCRRIFYGD